MSIGFWKKESGNLMSHGKGLNAEQILFLKSLKEGERVIIYLNTVKDEKQPQFTLKKYSKDEI